MAVAMDSRAFRTMMNTISFNTGMPVIITDGVVVIGRLNTEPISMEDPDFETWFNFGNPDINTKPENVLAFYRYME